MNCRICNTVSEEVFSELILYKYHVKYFLCPSCEYLFTEDPYWLNEAYSESINLTDTGLVERNLKAAKITSFILAFFFRGTKKCLDYGGGYGLFTRLMRDSGYDFCWTDPFTPNLMARGFDYKGESIDMITCFECFEHLSNPIEEVEKIIKISRNVFFSTLLRPEVLPDKSWHYFAYSHGQHISFYTKNTLKVIAQKYNLNVYTTDGYHLFTPKKINGTLFKLLYWLGCKSLDVCYLHWIVKKMRGSKSEQDARELEMVKKLIALEKKSV